MPTPADVLASALRSDPGRPRITCYDDFDGPTRGERIELSARVLANWVSKAANAMQEEWDVAPGSVVRLVLPPHWRALYWALAVWSVGGCVASDDGEDADLLVTDDPELAASADGPAVLVTLAGLARAANGPVPTGVMDEARELATYPDQFAPWEEPADDDPALRADGATTAYGSVVPQRDWPAGTRLHTGTDRLLDFLLDALAVWSVDGSVVLSRGPGDEAVRRARMAAEGVTLER